MKLPSSRTRQAAITIEINPVDSAGSATKKRGIVVRSASELDEFKRILANQKLVELAERVNQVGSDRSVNMRLRTLIKILYNFKGRRV